MPEGLCLLYLDSVSPSRGSEFEFQWSPLSRASSVLMMLSKFRCAGSGKTGHLFPHRLGLLLTSGLLFLHPEREAAPYLMNHRRRPTWMKESLVLCVQWQRWWFWSWRHSPEILSLMILSRWRNGCLWRAHTQPWAPRGSGVPLSNLLPQHLSSSDTPEECQALSAFHQTKKILGAFH